MYDKLQWWLWNVTFETLFKYVLKTYSKIYQEMIFGKITQIFDIYSYTEAHNHTFISKYVCVCAY